MEVHGYVADGFEAVRTAFEENFEQHGEVGAGVAAYLDGQLVVDLWGGLSDRAAGRPWRQDTLSVIASATKAATAICALMLAERGVLDLDSPVARYWPEFAAEGKGTLPVRWLLSHRAGLPAVDRKLTRDEVYAWDPLVAALADQEPYWEPGTKFGYHALTFGYLVGEVVRRITGKSLGTFFADEVAGPLGLDFWIGLPKTEVPRVAVAAGLGLPMDPDTDPAPEVRQLMELMLDPKSVTHKAFNICDPPIELNDEAGYGAEIPAGNGIATARSLAKMYAAVVGEVDGVRLLRPETVDAAIVTQSSGQDCLVPVSKDSRWGSGFMLAAPTSHMLPDPPFGPRAFGHQGAGGRLGTADPDSRIAFGYITNMMMQPPQGGDPRTVGLMAALRNAMHSTAAGA